MLDEKSNEPDECIKGVEALGSHQARGVVLLRQCSAHIIFKIVFKKRVPIRRLRLPTATINLKQWHCMILASENTSTKKNRHTSKS